jgi:hypothetical protein
MKSSLKPAGTKAWALLRKLQSLAERGIDGERLAAQHKIARLKARYDFSGLEPAEPLDLFSGNFKPSATARRVCSFKDGEVDVANAVKWAIESATKISCLFRGNDLRAEAAPATARRLGDIAAHITLHFRSLLDRFSAFDGVTVGDRAAFAMGLYDGMMNESRSEGQALPKRFRANKKRKTKKADPAPDARLNAHPYTIALGLGRQIRFSAPLAEITAELEAQAPKPLAAPTACSS